MSDNRKLARIERIEEIIPIEGADRIQSHRVLNWNVIGQKGLYEVGDRVIFIEPDAWIPNKLAPFLTKPDRFPKEYMGIEGERLKTMKMKGVYSQGLLLPIAAGNSYIEEKLREDDPESMPTSRLQLLEDGADITIDLGIVQWEPAPEKVPVNAKGSFPHHTPKTDLERVQNFMRNVEVFLEKNPGVTFTVEEKAEGSSHTTYLKDDDFGICSRNLALKTDDPAAIEGNHFLKTVFDLDLKNKLESLGRNISIQSEVIGPMIQDNIYQLKAWELRNFDIWDIDAQRYLSPVERREMAKSLGMESVPTINEAMDISGMTADELLKFAEGPTRIGSTGTLREGVVFKANTTERFVFKCVSQKYLELHNH